MATDGAIENVQELVEVEALEAPPRSQAIRPGHLWQNETREILHSDIKGARVASMETAEEILFILKRQHGEVIQRLDWQESTLKEMKQMQDASMRLTSKSRRTSLFSCESDRTLNTGDLVPVGLSTKSPTEAAVEEVARLFRTFESIDADLKEGAASVDEQEAANRKKRAQSLSHFPEHSGCLWRLTKNPWFDIFFACVVLTNSIFIGVEVSYSIHNGGETEPLIEVIRYTYSVVFTVELILRLLAQGLKFLISDEWMWNWLDVFIVLTSIWEMITDLVLKDLFADDTNVTFTGLKALRLVRITRIIKVARLARVLRFVMALRTLISSIIYTLKSLIWAMILLGLIVYVFSVLFAQAVGDALIENSVGSIPHDDVDIASMRRYFGTLEDTMLSLFMSIAGGVSWEEVVRPLKVISIFWVVVFLFYIAFTYFAVLNVVTGVFCQSAIDSAQNDETMVLQSLQAANQANRQKIIHLFRNIDVEQTGVLTYKMLEAAVNSDDAGKLKTMCESIGLDVWDAWSFFKLLDQDAGGAVEESEFLTGCMRLRGGARAMDVVKILVDQGWLIRQQSRFMTYMEEQMEAMKDRLDELKEMNEKMMKHKK